MPKSLNGKTVKADKVPNRVILGREQRGLGRWQRNELHQYLKRRVKREDPNKRPENFLTTCNKDL